jgi:hypothetical protein
MWLCVSGVAARSVTHDLVNSSRSFHLTGQTTMAQGGFLVRQQVEHAVELQARSYKLLQWLEKAFDDGFIAPETAHAYASMEASAYSWIAKHYKNLPDTARPELEDLMSFSKLFSTYLLSTFDLEANPGERLYSPAAHCFCPLCSWMVRVPHLRPKKVSAADKATADKMKRGAIRALAGHAAVTSSDEHIDTMLRTPELREAIGLYTYACDLLQRMRGIASGPATLALWRSFAWTPQGSPKKGFVLSAEAIMEAQQVILQRLTGLEGGSS